MKKVVSKYKDDHSYATSFLLRLNLKSKRVQCNQYILLNGTDKRQIVQMRKRTNPVVMRFIVPACAYLNSTWSVSSGVPTVSEPLKSSNKCINCFLKYETEPLSTRKSSKLEEIVHCIVGLSLNLDLQSLNIYSCESICLKYPRCI